MPWLLGLPGYQHPRYWLCSMGKYLSYMRKDFNDMCHVSVEECYKFSIYVYASCEKLNTQRVNICRAASRRHVLLCPWHWLNCCTDHITQQMICIASPEERKSVSRWFLCSWWVRPLTAITFYDIFICPWEMWKYFQNCNFKLVLRIDVLSISCEIALRRMPQNPFDDKSILFQVMAWCLQATSQYLIQCWPRFMWPHGVSRPQWVNDILSNSGWIKQM